MEYVVFGRKTESHMIKTQSLNDAVQEFRKQFPDLKPFEVSQLNDHGESIADFEIVGFCESCGYVLLGGEEYTVDDDCVRVCAQCAIHHGMVDGHL